MSGALVNTRKWQKSKVENHAKHLVEDKKAQKTTNVPQGRNNRRDNF